MFSRQISSSIDHSSVQKYDVAIIGAGLSGLVAAYKLIKLLPSISLIILEAKDRTGGRLYTVDLPACNNSIDSWDLGGSWIGNKTVQPLINDLLEELNTSSYPQNFTGTKMLQVGHKNTIYKYESSIPFTGVISMMDSALLINYLNNVQGKKLNNSNNVDKVNNEFDTITASSLFKRKTWTSCLADCVRVVSRAGFGTELEKMSALYMLIYSNSCGGFQRMVESGEDSAQGYRISGGAQNVCEKLLDKIGRQKIIFEAPVRSIDQVFDEFQNSYSVIKINSGNTITAKYVILAIPCHLIPNIIFSPPLSPSKYEYVSSVCPGHLIKVILTYEKAFWKERGYSGEIVTNGGPGKIEGCSTGPLTTVFDCTTDKGSPALIALIGGKQALEYEYKTKEERKEAVLQSLESFFPDDNVRNFIVYCEKIWRHEQYVGGCPVSTVPPGVACFINDDLRKPENGIHFAGTELAKTWIGFMEGAVERGYQTALEISEKFKKM